MRQTIAAALAAAAVLSLAACGPSSPAPAAAPASPTTPSTPAALPKAAAAGPLKLAAFPSASGGKDARGVCEQWAGLRGEYAGRTATDSPYQLNQWFSSAAWRKAWSDATALGNDPAYANLETAYGLATLGDAAGPANARLMDSACAKGD
jgi:predicted small lipoprotein YifL